MNVPSINDQGKYEIKNYATRYVYIPFGVSF